MAHRFLIVPFLIALLPPFLPAQDIGATQGEIAQRVQHLMSVEVGFEEMVPPGTSIEAKEISRNGKSGNDLIVRYHIFVKGVAQDILLQYLDWPINADKASLRLRGISVGKDGILMCAGRTAEQCGDTKKPDDPIEFTTIPRKGEPTLIAFVSQSIKIGMVIVADPIEARDKGCSLSVVRLTPKFDLAFPSGRGYAPNADVHYRVSSETINDFTIKSDSSGTIRVSVIPNAGKKDNGKVVVKVVETACSPELSYEWGTN